MTTACKSAITTLSPANSGTNASTSALNAVVIVGAVSDVTETRQRDRELETAKAEAAAAYRQDGSADAPTTPTEERYALAMESISSRNRNPRSGS